ncbi:hypothetical protein P872_00245 [Rhodonellum psychrophilum GCM71 = DSM 17998]|uniref:Uncharacterized protein n=1 Tax=Rhodonellum psychrophilum GCM71 = DSM 17998 TaxID=1123057 RepID=U5C155_9BACT|nr:hypothetical protein P872_00245 [Rhodonellum psychrophilum GCM71 = DSM 17998]
MYPIKPIIGFYSVQIKFQELFLIEKNSENHLVK